jgi:hypothetical protein
MTFYKLVSYDISTPTVKTDASHPDSVFIVGRPLDNLAFEFIVHLCNKLESKSLQNHCRRYAMTEQIIELCPDL